MRGAGNHDFILEKNSKSHSINFPEGITYLENSLTNIEELTIWGSPYTPEFYNWAFMKKRGEQIRQVWKMIPSQVDILVTHGPPYSILDKNDFGTMCGCEELLIKVKEVKPKVHVFGHIHESYGMIEDSGTMFINASIVDGNYHISNSPIVVEIQ